MALFSLSCRFGAYRSYKTFKQLILFRTFALFPSCQTSQQEIVRGRILCLWGLLPHNLGVHGRFLCLWGLLSSTLGGFTAGALRLFLSMLRRYLGLQSGRVVLVALQRIAGLVHRTQKEQLRAKAKRRRELKSEMNLAGWYEAAYYGRQQVSHTNLSLLLRFGLLFGLIFGPISVSLISA